jgi:hypothetical protein
VDFIRRVKKCVMDGFMPTSSTSEVPVLLSGSPNITVNTVLSHFILYWYLMSRVFLMPMSV